MRETPEMPRIYPSLTRVVPKNAKISILPEMPPMIVVGPIAIARPSATAVPCQEIDI